MSPGPARRAAAGLVVVVVVAVIVERLSLRRQSPPQALSHRGCSLKLKRLHFGNETVPCLVGPNKLCGFCEQLPHDATKEAAWLYL